MDLCIEIIECKKVNNIEGNFSENINIILEWNGLN